MLRGVMPTSDARSVTVGPCVIPSDTPSGIGCAPPSGARGSAPTVPGCRGFPYPGPMPSLPPDLVERARAFARGTGVVSPTRDAATVVLLRDRPAGPEVYLLRRAPSMAFAAGMHVFPGGSVDPRDAAQATAWAGPPPSHWAGLLGCDEELARALVCAAVRETFEESGILLAGSSPDDVVADTTEASWEDDRLALLDRSLSLA